MELRTLQDSVSRFLYEACPDRDAEGWIEQYVVAYPPPELQSRLKVYRNNLATALTETLTETYPVTRAVLSTEVFGKVARKFIYGHPSRTADLNQYSREFPDFLHTLNDLSPFVTDLARLEWHWNECAYLADDEAMTIEQANTMLFSTPLKLRASARILETSYAILDLWRQVKDACGKIDALSFNIEKNSQRLFLWKDKFKRNIHAVEDELWPALWRINKAYSLEKIAEASELKEDSHRLGECLQVLVMRGWLHRP